ncbi:DUF4845 domain-containing protein [Allohahella marinimesophila]|uniref:DUF4845 domain-containing protein n=1 Tax=Allohahella marinimesophila TaxID=1054972 RepID=A0ABP7Q552_9GAMM
MMQYLFYLLVLVSFITVAVKLIPVYIEDSSVSGSLESLSQKENFADMTNKEILTSLGSLLTINNIRSLPPEAIKIERKDDVTTVSIDYEVRKNIVANIDAVLSFQHKQDSKKK